MTSILLDSSAPTPLTSWVAIGIGVLTVVYIAFIRPFKRDKKKDPLSRAAPEPGLARQRGVERDVSNLLVELSEMTRQMTAQIDTRAAKLEALIREADEKISMLRSLGSGCGIGGEPHGILVEAKLLEADAVRMRTVVDPVPAADPRHAEVYDLADEGQSAQEIARQTGRPSGEVELILALRGR
jgi:hypothetical protein